MKTCVGVFVCLGGPKLKSSKLCLRSFTFDWEWRWEDEITLHRKNLTIYGDPGVEIVKVKGGCYAPSASLEAASSVENARGQVHCLRVNS